MSFNLINPFFFPANKAWKISNLNLVAYYPMDSDVLDYSGNANNGTLSGTTNYVSSTVAGTGFAQTISLTAGTAGHVTVPYASGMNGSGGTKLSVMCWVKRRTTGDMTHVDRFAGAWRLMSRYNAGDILVTAGGATASITGVPTAGVNTHIGFTYDGANIKVYKNGAQLGGNTAATGVMSDTTTNLWIGRQHGGTNQYMSGEIEEVIIYQRVLTVPEIALLYSGGTPLLY